VVVAFVVVVVAFVVVVVAFIVMVMAFVVVVAFVVREAGLGLGTLPPAAASVAWLTDLRVRAILSTKSRALSGIVACSATITARVPTVDLLVSWTS